MNDYESNGQETSGCIGLKTTVCPNGVINVKRPQSDSAHSVFVDGDGDVIRCSCKGHKFNGHCVHQDEIAKRPLVVSSAVAAAADTDQQVATDGGQPVETTEESDQPTCDRCGSTPELGTEFAGSSGFPYCSEYSELCGSCVLEHGPDECDHNDEQSPGTGFQTATGWGTTDRRVPDDEDEEIDDTPL